MLLHYMSICARLRVLHGDDGAPAALIHLESLTISDYSDGTLTKRPADPEHIALVEEFREEYIEQVEAAGEDAFAAGLIFPALAWVESSGIGLEQIREYLNQIPSLS